MAKYNLPVTKDQIASSMGIRTGGDVSSRENGRVGGQMVKATFEQFGQKRQIAFSHGDSRAVPCFMSRVR